MAPQRREPALRLAVIGGDRPAAEEVVCAWRRATCRVDLVERDEEVGQVGGEPRHVRDPLGGGWIAVDPPVHRPGPGEAAARHALRQRFGDGQGQLPGQHRQPAVLLVHLLDVNPGAGQPDGHGLAQAERGVVDPISLDGPDRQASPLRELIRDQPGDQIGRDVRFAHDTGSWHADRERLGCRD